MIYLSEAVFLSRRRRLEPSRGSGPLPVERNRDDVGTRPAWIATSEDGYSDNAG